MSRLDGPREKVASKLHPMTESLVHIRSCSDMVLQSGNPLNKSRFGWTVGARKNILNCHLSPFLRRQKTNAAFWQFWIRHNSLSPIFSCHSFLSLPGFAGKITPLHQIGAVFSPQETGNQKKSPACDASVAYIKASPRLCMAAMTMSSIFGGCFAPSRAVKTPVFFITGREGVCLLLPLFFWKNFTQILVIGVFVKKNWGSLRNWKSLGHDRTTV